MPDTGQKKRKSRAGSREGEDDDGPMADLRAWLDTVPLISVAPEKQVRPSSVSSRSTGVMRGTFGPGTRENKLGL